MTQNRIQAALPLTLLALGAGCAPAGDETQSAAEATIAVPLPAFITDVRAVDKDAVTPLLTIDGTTYSMSRSGDSWSATASVSKNASHSINLSWTELYNGRDLPLGEYSGEVSVGGSAQSVNIDSSDYNFASFDLDGDGSSNLEERRAGTNPYLDNTVASSVDVIIPRIGSSSSAPTLDGRVNLSAGEWSDAVRLDTDGAIMRINNLMFEEEGADLANGRPYSRWSAMHDGTYLYLLVLADDNGNRQYDSSDAWDDDDVDIYLDGGYSHTSTGLDSAGKVVVLERQYYDAFGLPLKGSTDARTAGISDSDITKQGYTGHESLTAFGLIQMNARLYDPVLGRFISADTFVQSPLNLQSYNRYSYVLNNPLSYTDPTGHFSISINDAFLYGYAEDAVRWMRNNPKVVVQIAFTVAVATAAGPLSPWAAGAIAGGFGGAFGAYMAGGSGEDILVSGIKGAAIGAISGGVNDYIGGVEGLQGFNKVLVHGVAGGAVNALRAGSLSKADNFFKDGFISATVTQAASQSGIVEATSGTKLGRAMTAAAIGGTASKLGGGDFANGALTGAFQRLFNDDAHTEEQRRAAAIEGFADFVEQSRAALGDANADRLKSFGEDYFDSLDFSSNSTQGIVFEGTAALGVGTVVGGAFVVDQTGMSGLISGGISAGFSAGVSFTVGIISYPGARDGLEGFGGAFNANLGLLVGGEYEMIFSSGSVGHYFGPAFSPNGIFVGISNEFTYTKALWSRGF
jgi:RHS repeat-associated protein